MDTANIHYLSSRQRCSPESRECQSCGSQFLDSGEYRAPATPGYFCQGCYDAEVLQGFREEVWLDAIDHGHVRPLSMSRTAYYLLADIVRHELTPLNNGSLTLTTAIMNRPARAVAVSELVATGLLIPTEPDKSEPCPVYGLSFVPRAAAIGQAP